METLYSATETVAVVFCALRRGSLIALLFAVVETWRLQWRRRRVAVGGGARLAAYRSFNIPISGIRTQSGRLFSS